MKQIFLTLCGIAALVVTAQARLGESIEQCRTRYGDPLQFKIDDKLTGIATYTKNDLNIQIHFLNGKADLVRYSSGLVSTIDFDLAKYLLQVNGRDKEWDLLTKTHIVLNEDRDENAQYPRVVLEDPILWKSKDGILEASFSTSQSAFEVRASSFQEKIRQGL